jgi:hypothetical protein
MILERAQVLIEALQRAVLDGVHEFEGEPDRIRVDLGLIPVFADERPLQGLAGLMDWRRSGRISRLVRSGFCTGAAGERVLMPGGPSLPIERMVLVGLGPRGDFDKDAARRVAGDLVATATGLGAERVLVALPSHAERRPAELLFAALTEAIEQADRDRAAALEPPPEPPAEAAPHEVAPEPPAEAGSDNEPSSSPESGPPASADVASEVAPGPPDEPLTPEPLAPEPPLLWWVVADERVVARLRRVLSGPPRATTGGLHT